MTDPNDDMADNGDGISNQGRGMASAGNHPHADCGDWCDGDHEFPVTSEEQEYADFVGLQNFTREGYQIAKHLAW